MATGRVPTTANSPLTAKGDLFTYSTASARLAVGNNGESLVADSSATTGLRYNANFAAGKNKIINGDFGIWQRGTSFSSISNVYTADRFQANTDATSTVSRQTFTAGTAPVAGYEGTYFSRFSKGAGGSYATERQPIEDVRTFAGQTITLSLWAKASTTISLEPYFEQIFGTGGSSTVGGVIGSAVSLTTSWTRYSFSVTLPSIAGKTIGTNNSLNIYPIRYLGSAAVDIDIWGVQVEAGSVATAFQTATGTIQGETSACQRYFYSLASGASSSFLSTGGYENATTAIGAVFFPVTMRTTPVLSATSGTNYYQAISSGGGTDNFNSLSITNETSRGAYIFNNTEAAGTAGQMARILTANSSASVAFSAEL
jgi:hypothetical protein